MQKSILAILFTGLLGLFAFPSINLASATPTGSSGSITGTITSVTTDAYGEVISIEVVSFITEDGVTTPFSGTVRVTEGNGNDDTLRGARNNGAATFNVDIPGGAQSGDPPTLDGGVTLSN